MSFVKRCSRMLRTVMNDESRKPLHTILAEVTRLWLRDSVPPSHYYSGLLYRRDFDDNIYAYVGCRSIGEMYARINDPQWTPILNNKVLFDLFFGQTDIRLPRLVGFSAGNQFTIGDNVMWVSDGQRLQDALALLVKSSSTASIFAKPAGGFQGKGCFEFDLLDVSKTSADKSSRLLKGCYVYQEVIAQHPKMAELHPPSVNTLRIETYRRDQGEVNVISAFARMGAKGSCVDNASSGGCFVGIDLEHGALMRRGFMLPEQKPAILERHPDTGVIFGGFVIPFFREAVMVVKRAAAMIPVTVVGWDVAITPDGPVLIEGSSTHDVRVAEIAYGGYWRNPIFRRLVEDHAPQMSRIGKRFDRLCPGEVRPNVED
jgi:hypothetical protein